MRQLINYLRHAMTNKTVVLSAFVLSVAATAGVGIYNINQQNAMAMVQDCSTNSIVRCGVANYAQLTQKYDANAHGDLRAIYDHYWIQRAPAAGDQVVTGWAKNDGTVVVNGRVVAKNAASIGREAISGSHAISIAGKTYYQTTHVGGQAFAPGTTQLEALVVLDANGNFKYAIIKACGNPIYATPVPPPAPEPKDIQVCELESGDVITIKEDQFNEQIHSKNLADCEPKQIQVCKLATKEIVTINEDEFDSDIYSKNLEDCKEVPIVYVKVCDTRIDAIVSVTEDAAKDDRYTTNFDTCKEKPEEPKVVVVKTPVEPTPPTPVVETPTALPTTGGTSILSTGLGLLSMSLATYYYALSRRS